MTKKRNQFFRFLQKTYERVLDYFLDQNPLKSFDTLVSQEPIVLNNGDYVLKKAKLQASQKETVFSSEKYQETYERLFSKLRDHKIFYSKNVVTWFLQTPSARRHPRIVEGSVESFNLNDVKFFENETHSVLDRHLSHTDTTSGTRLLCYLVLSDYFRKNPDFALSGCQTPLAL